MWRIHAGTMSDAFFRAENARPCRGCPAFHATCTGADRHVRAGVRAQTYPFHSCSSGDVTTNDGEHILWRIFQVGPRARSGVEQELRDRWIVA
jgi:hypothetical protein